MADSSLTPESVQKLKVADLKRELKDRGLPVSGSKAELAERLLKGLEDVGSGDVDTSLADQDLSLDSKNISFEDVDDSILTKDTKKEEPDLTEEPPKKKIALIAPVKITSKPEPVTSPTGLEKVKFPEDTTPEADKLKERSERFGITSEKSKLQVRAERFGIQASDKTTSVKQAASTNMSEEDINKLKKRAERFGATVSTALTQVDNLDKLKKRAERFGTSVSSELSKVEEADRILKRKDRFGTVTSTNTVGSKATSASLTEVDEKKRKRAERFGLS